MLRNTSLSFFQQSRKYSSDRFCKLLVIGGGSGGCSVAAKFASKLKPGDVVVIEPAQVRGWFLVEA